jgi:hypothetical protein
MQNCHESDTGVIVETMLIHESGETLSSGKLHVPAAKQDPQGYGSALTYARRYSLMAACGIAPEDDDGNAASRKPTQDVSVALKSIMSAESLDQLKAHYTAAYAMFKTDKDAITKLSAAKDERKKELTDV